MLYDMVLDMPAIEELLHLSNLSLRVEPNQVHKFQVIGFIWYESERFMPQEHIHSPYFDVAVHKDSTAAQADSPPPITRRTSTLIVSTFNAAETRS